jgi:hypothetical protein
LPFPSAGFDGVLGVVVAHEVRHDFGSDLGPHASRAGDAFTEVAGVVVVAGEVDGCPVDAARVEGAIGDGFGGDEVAGDGVDDVLWWRGGEGVVVGEGDPAGEFGCVVEASVCAWRGVGGSDAVSFVAEGEGAVPDDAGGFPHGVDGLFVDGETGLVAGAFVGVDITGLGWAYNWPTAAG